MTPAEELRAAATLVRETAREALGGYLGELPADWLAFYSRAVRKFMLPADDVAWIKLMHPGLAEPIAAWLEGCAGEATAMLHAEDWSICDEPASVQAAVKVARALLGSSR